MIEQSTPGPSATPEPTLTFPPQQTLAPAATIQPWTGTSRLNILLVGADTRGGIRTDSMIVVSIDPVSHQVALFSILRDATGVPMPPKSRLSQLFGPTFNSKLTNLWEFADKYRNLFPGGGADALKQALGYTFFGDQNAIQYYVEVGFSGFEKVVDTLGGVTINVPAPVFDNGFPSNQTDNVHLRVFFPAGIQHMDGNEALTYARIGHVLGSSVYARTIRQQQVVVALEQQANFNDISAHLGDLVDTLGSDRSHGHSGGTRRARADDPAGQDHQAGRHQELRLGHFQSQLLGDPGRREGRDRPQPTRSPTLFRRRSPRAPPSSSRTAPGSQGRTRRLRPTSRTWASTPRRAPTIRRSWAARPSCSASTAPTHSTPRRWRCCSRRWA